MSSIITAAQRRRTLSACLQLSLCLFSRWVFPLPARSRSLADQLPPIEVNPPDDAEPNPGQAGHRRRIGSAPRRTGPSRTNQQPERRAGERLVARPTQRRIRQFAGIVGAATTVITAEDIAHSPAQTVQEIIAQTPGVQLTSLFGGVNGAQDQCRPARIWRVRDLQ